MTQKRILVAEDDRNTQKMISFLLSSEGYQVELASNGPEAMAILRNTHPDLVVMDATLKQGDGFALCLAMKKNGNGHGLHKGSIVDAQKGVFVILISAADIEARRNSREWKAIAKADDFIAKPFEPQRLTESVDRLLK